MTDNLPILDFAETMASLPAQQPDDGLDAAIQKALSARYDVVIVLDDDPTGTQTVYDVPVVTERSEEAILEELERGTLLFFLLTNSRMYPPREVAEGSVTLGGKIRRACEKAGKHPLVIIRGDSTLRGHFDYEDRFIASGLGYDGLLPFLIPAFFEGGRYTINDVHYVQEEDQLIPAAQTPFAEDTTFGYRDSNLKEWIKGKTYRGKILVADAISISLTDLRANVPSVLRDKIVGKQKTQTCIVNAADYTDLKRAALAILRFAEQPQLRTSASFIKALLGQPDRPLLKIKTKEGKGGLIIVGSHVPKTTAQLQHLQQHNQLVEFEVDVKRLVLDGPEFAQATKFESLVKVLIQSIEEALNCGDSVLVYTSREVITAKGVAANLNIAALVSSYLEAVVGALKIQPSFLLTKGGITSSRIATEALGVKRAMALGQVQPGVPTWELGQESKFPGMPFIIYPGNVGGVEGLSSILENTMI